jgi:hypothetical protein
LNNKCYKLGIEPQALCILHALATSGRLPVAPSRCDGLNSISGVVWVLKFSSYHPMACHRTESPDAREALIELLCRQGHRSQKITPRSPPSKPLRRYKAQAYLSISTRSRRQPKTWQKAMSSKGRQTPPSSSFRAATPPLTDDNSSSESDSVESPPNTPIHHDLPPKTTNRLIQVEGDEVDELFRKYINLDLCM